MSVSVSTSEKGERDRARECGREPGDVNYHGVCLHPKRWTGAEVELFVVRFERAQARKKGGLGAVVVVEGERSHYPKKKK